MPFNFQIVIKIDQNGCCVIDIEFEHNNSLETLEAANFRDISSDCADKIYKLYESGHTRSTARQQYIRKSEKPAHMIWNSTRRRQIGQWCQGGGSSITSTPSLVMRGLAEEVQ